MNFTINPLLVRALSNTPDINSTGLESPHISQLPSKYIQPVLQNSNKVESVYEENKQILICGHCNNKGTYNIGLVGIDVAKFKSGKVTPSIEDVVQLTGYFRCNHCNKAGNWIFPEEFKVNITIALMGELDNQSSKFHLGKMQLHDGSAHKFGSDAEEHFLQKLEQSPSDGFLWSRLANTYYKGNRPDLAALAFEKAIEVDPYQTESYYSLGRMLFEIGEDNEATLLFYKVLLSARNYGKLPPKELRKIVTFSLISLIELYEKTNGQISLIPPLDLQKEMDFPSITEVTDAVTEYLAIDNRPKIVESLYPLADLFLSEKYQRQLKRSQKIKKKGKSKKKK